MPIKASGSPLALSEIATFWGGSQPHSLSEYYSGGSLVFSGAEDEAGNDIPSSSTIKVSDFYSTHTVTTGATTDFECNTSFGIPITTTTLFTIPRGVSTLTITLYGAGGSGGEGDETGAGGGGGGGGSGGVVQGTLTISNNIQTNPNVSYPQTVSVTVGAGGKGGDPDKASGGATAITFLGQTTQASGGGHGGGYGQGGGGAGEPDDSYSAGTTNSNTIGGSFSASTNVTGTTGDGAQGGSNSGNFSSVGTAGKTVPSNPLSITSTGGAAGTLASNSAATGGNASGFGAGGGGAASIDRTGALHWYGGRGAPGFVRIVVTS